MSQRSQKNKKKGRRKVLKDRNDGGGETRQKAIEKVRDVKDNEITKNDADKLNNLIPQDKILGEWSKVTDGAQGLDNVQIAYVKQTVNTAQKTICIVILEMTNKHPC